LIADEDGQEPVAIPSGAGVTLVDLKRDQCHYPVGELQPRRFVYCGGGPASRTLWIAPEPGWRMSAQGRMITGDVQPLQFDQGPGGDPRLVSGEA
jgi:hypothetical protein